MEKKHNITQKVIDYFIKKIENGEWIVGNKIPSEKELTLELGASRSSIRAAIQQFIGIGAMESKHGKGTFLKTNNLSNFGKREKKITSNYIDMNAILEFRLILESESCNYAAERITEENLEVLRNLLKKMQLSIGKPIDFVHYDMQFHLEIISATHNKLVINALKEVFTQKEEYFHSFNETFGYVDGIYYHTLLLKALEAKDGNRAKRIMKSHLQKAIDDIYYEKSIK